MDKQVAIVGNASISRDLAPFADQSIQIWALTFHGMKMPRVNMVFEMHPDVLDGERWQKYEGIEDYRAWLKRQREVPVIMHRKHKEIPASLEYPRQEVARKYRLHKGEKTLKYFFGGSASYAIALAAHLCYTHIHLYGIELAHEEYRRERDAVFYWMGRCDSLGIHIHIPQVSNLYADMLYPME